MWAVIFILEACDRGRKDRFPDLPSLRTGQAVFPHPALRSMVLPLNGLTGLCTGILQEKEPKIGKVGIHCPPFTLFQEPSTYALSRHLVQPCSIEQVLLRFV